MCTSPTEPPHVTTNCFFDCQRNSVRFQQRSNYAVSSLLDSLVDDKGDERLLIRWYRPSGVMEEGQHGTCDGSHGHGGCEATDCQAMRDITIGSKADIGKDYAGLRADLCRRQQARAARGADRHWRLSQYWASIAVQKGGEGHTHRWSRWDARSLDPGSFYELETSMVRLVHMHRSATST